MALLLGPGGSGKRTLAAQALTRYGRRYKAILTLSCLGYEDLGLFLRRIAEFLHQQGTPGLLETVLPDAKLSIEAKMEATVHALNQAGPFVLVVDNLESVQNEDQTLRDRALLSLLQKLLTNLRNGRVVVTGRYAVKGFPPEGRFAAHLLRLDLDDLSRYETNQLLTRHSTLAHLGETARSMLINEFGGLPYVYDLLSSDAASQSLDLLVHDVQNRRNLCVTTIGALHQSNELLTAQLVGQLGIIAYLQGDYPEARRLYQQSLETFERLGDLSGKANSLGQLGVLAYEEGEVENALKYTIQAFLLLDRLHSPARATAQRMLTRIRQRMDEPAFFAHWRAIAGNLPPPPLTEGDRQQQLLQTVIDFIQAPTWDASQQFLETHAELLQSTIDTVLQELAAQQEHEGARKTIEDRRLLLQRCREIGVAAAFAERVVSQDPRTAFLEGLTRLCNEVVVVLRTNNAEQKEALAARLEQMAQGDLPVADARVFLQVLVAWIRGQDAQARMRQVETLPSPFREAYDQMVAAVEQEAESEQESQTTKEPSS